MRYDILKDFKGSQTGSTAEDFKAGTQADLSDYLVSCVNPAWIRPAGAVAPTAQTNAAGADPAPSGHEPSLLDRATSAVHKFRKGK